MQQTASPPIAVAAGTRATTGPVRVSERIVVVDVLRGFAILGIFLVNMLGFTGYALPFEQLTPLDKAATLFIRLFAQAKFYPLFSFLFGWGMAMQMIRAEEKGGPFVRLYVRRLLGLLLIGLIHAILIWDGDILVSYALLGFPLLLFRKASNRVLLIAAALFLLTPILVSLPGPGADFRQWHRDLTAPLWNGIEFGHVGAYANGTYLEAVQYRLKYLPFSLSNFIYWGGHIFAMFLIGLYFGKNRLFQNVKQNLPLFRKILVGGLLIGLPLNLLWVAVSVKPELVPAELVDLANRGARTISGSALSLAYVAAIVLLFQRETWQEQLLPLANVGRLALSNYLFQSVLCTWIFYGYGLGAYGELGPALATLLVFIIYRVQIALSGWWLVRFRFGPAEWFWRCLTYGRVQPLRA